jgi:undecaprenyl-diphosphatase
MPLFHLIILALVQGITEFLPISSSGHLILTHWVLEGENGAQINFAANHLLDIAVHVGTLLAVILYFRTDVRHLIGGACDVITRKETANRRLTLLVLIGSLPVILTGALMQYYLPNILNSVAVIATTSIVFGLLLGWADRRPEVKGDAGEMSFKQALMIGLMQAVALIPGTSRSGITMTAGRFLKLTRVEAARFSLLLSMVAISGAGVLGGMSLYRNDALVIGQDVVIGILLSFFSAYATIWVMMKSLKSISFMPFVIYRVVLGVVLLALLGFDVL